MTRKWPDDDIAMIKTGSWPHRHALCLKKPPLVHGHGDDEFGCITPDAKSTVVKTNVWNWNPNAEKIEYNSVEEMVNDGWMVD